MKRSPSCFLILVQPIYIKEEIIAISKANCKEVTNRVAFLYSKASTNIPPKSGPKKNPVAKVVVNIPETMACRLAPFVSSSKSADSNIVALRRAKQDVNWADSPTPFKKSAVMINVSDVGRYMNGAGPINIEEMINNVVPMIAIGIPFSVLNDVKAQTNVNTDKVAPCKTNISPKNLVSI